MLKRSGGVRLSTKGAGLLKYIEEDGKVHFTTGAHELRKDVGSGPRGWVSILEPQRFP